MGDAVAVQAAVLATLRDASNDDDVWPGSPLRLGVGVPTDVVAQSLSDDLHLAVRDEDLRSDETVAGLIDRLVQRIEAAPASRPAELSLT